MVKCNKFLLTYHLCCSTLFDCSTVGWERWHVKTTTIIMNTSKIYVMWIPTMNTGKSSECWSWLLLMLKRKGGKIFLGVLWSCWFGWHILFLGSVCVICICVLRSATACSSLPLLRTCMVHNFTVVCCCVMRCDPIRIRNLLIQIKD